MVHVCSKLKGDNSLDMGVFVKFAFLIAICFECVTCSDTCNLVENFHCVLYESNNMLICSWSVTEETENVSLRVKSILFDWRDCPEYSLQRTRCTWRGSMNFQLKTMVLFVWDFSLMVRNCRQQFKLKPKDCVKPSPVIQLKVENTSDPTCLTISWAYNEYRKNTVKIKYIMEWEMHTAMEVHTTVQATRKSAEKKICKLIPHTKYTFTVYAKQENGIYYSDPATISYKTEEDVPAAAPPIAVGSYGREINSCVSDHSFLNVTVYWNEIPTRYRYGKIIGYSLTIMDDRNMYKNITVFYSNILWAVIELRCDRTYNVSITAMTNKGISENASSILIAMATDKAWYPPDILVIMEKTGTGYMYNISWTDKAITDQHGYNYTVHYCPKSVVTCKGELQSVCVPTTDMFYALHLAYPPPLLIGVSMDRGIWSSGVKFTSCIYNKTGVPATPKDIKVAAVLDNSLTVTWTSTSRCDGVLPYVVSYRIYWCEVNKGKLCTGDVFSDVIEACKSTYYKHIITGLNRGTEYDVRLQALSAYRQSANSSMYLAIPVNSDLSDMAIVGIAVGVVFVCILSSIGCYCIVRYCRMKTKELRDLNEVDIPTINKESNGMFTSISENYRRSISDIQTSHVERTSMQKTENGMLRTPSDKSLVDPDNLEIGNYYSKFAQVVDLSCESVDL